MLPLPCLLLLLAGMGSVTSTLHKYNISGTIYFTTENEVDKVMPNMHIDLMENDAPFNDDDNLGHAVTDGQGHFEVIGEEDEGDEPEPYLRIPNDQCTSLWKVCEGFRPYGLKAIWPKLALKTFV
jgi:hypothetical protein